MAKYPSHEANLAALKRIEGQVRGIRKMIENNKYCIDIINQIYAIKGALGRVEVNILKRHLQHCVTESVKGSSEQEKQQKLDEIIELFDKIIRG